MDMFNQLSSTLSNLSVTVSQIEKKQEKMERGPPSKRARYDYSDDEEVSESEEGEMYDSDEEITDQVNLLLNQPSSSRDGKSESERNQDGKWLAQLAQDLVNEDQRSPPIAQQLADILIGILSRKLGEDKLKEKMDLYPTPENLLQLITPKVNPEVWTKLKPETRSRDIRVQKVQLRLVRGLTALTQLAEKLLAAQKDKQNIDIHECLTLTLNGFAIIANGNIELSHRRRELIRPDLNTSYRELCSTNTPITDYLFGDELARVVKDIGETNRVATRVSGQGQYRGNSRFNYKGNRGGYKKFNNQKPKKLQQPSLQEGEEGGHTQQNSRR